MERGFLDHLDLSVTNVGRSAPVYDCLLTALGYERDMRAPQDRARWRLTGTVFSVEIRPALRAGAYERGAPGLEHVAFRARNPGDVHAVFDALQRDGFDVREPPRLYHGDDYEHGYYALGLEDPDGIHLEVVHWAE